MWNNGKGIPIEIHKEHNCFVPEMIFGQLLTSSNYDDKEQKVTGGRNGFGAKLANIFSTKFTVETGSKRKSKIFRLTWHKNMGVKEEPVIESANTEDFTKVTFTPDFRLFKMAGLEDDVIALFTKRVYDMAGITDSRVKVYLNNKRVDIKNFIEYTDLYLKSEDNKTLPKIVEKKSDRWEVVCSISDGSFQQVSFVNAICTSKGGTHVEYIAN